MTAKRFQGIELCLLAKYPGWKVICLSETHRGQYKRQRQETTPKSALDVQEHKRNCTTISHLNASRNLAKHQFTQNPVEGRAQRELCGLQLSGRSTRNLSSDFGLFSRSGSRLGRVLGVHKLNVSAKHTMEHFSCFWSRTLWVCHGFFDTDGLIAFRAFAETMTGVIHFVPRSKPTLSDQFWLFHVLSFPQAASPVHNSKLSSSSSRSNQRACPLASITHAP
jgi:hypothetical protein